MEKFNQAFKFKLKPTDQQVKLLSSWTGSCRFIFNLCLEHRILWWKQYQKSVSYYDQANQLKEMKLAPGFEWLKAVPAQCLQQAMMDLDKAFKAFFKTGFGFPQFKKKGGNESIRFPDATQFQVTQVNKKRGILVLPKIGKMRVYFSREVIGKIKNCTVRKECDGWYVSFCTERSIEIPMNVFPSIGIDRGISQTIALSNEEGFTKEQLTLPLSAKEIFERIKFLQRRLAKKKKFSLNWKKLKKRIGLLHRKIARIRQDFLHKLSNQLTKNHGLIVLEDLKIKNMSRSAKGNKTEPGKNVAAKSGLNREILFQGWGLFATMLNYKSKIRGGYLQYVPPQFTSTRCSECLFKSKDNRHGKIFECRNCGFKDDADENAAKNINTAGLAGRACGGVELNPAVEARTSWAH